LYFVFPFCNTPCLRLWYAASKYYCRLKNFKDTNTLAYSTPKIPGRAEGRQAGEVHDVAEEDGGAAVHPRRCLPLHLQAEKLVTE
jgi:hypothetical protein